METSILTLLQIQRTHSLKTWTNFSLSFSLTLHAPYLVFPLSLSFPPPLFKFMSIMEKPNQTTSFANSTSKPEYPPSFLFLKLLSHLLTVYITYIISIQRGGMKQGNSDLKKQSTALILKTQTIVELHYCKIMEPLTARDYNTGKKNLYV